jgi:hypothetical protein
MLHTFIIFLDGATIRITTMQNVAMSTSFDRRHFTDVVQSSRNDDWCFEFDFISEYPVHV